MGEWRSWGWSTWDGWWDGWRDQRWSGWSSSGWSWREADEQQDWLEEVVPVPVAVDALRPMKVVVLGMPKCGTTSLHEAFQASGFSSVHWALDAGKNLREDTALRLLGEGAEERLVGCLVSRAVQKGLPPFALLPEEAGGMD